MNESIKYIGGRISSLIGLSKSLDTTLERLEAIIESPPYKRKSIRKKSGDPRILHVPGNELKHLQKLVVGRIFTKVAFPNYLFGGIRDSSFPRDYIRCAEEHCGAGIVSITDIESYFDSIEDEQINPIFSELFNFPEDVSSALTAITMYENQLPQGAPTSSALANMVFFKSEPRIVRRCREDGVIYTRFIDDIILSHQDPAFPIDQHRQAVKRMLRKHNLAVNEKKSYNKKRNSKSLEVMNIIVNFRNPRVRPEERDRIRAAVHEVEVKSRIPNARKSADYHRLWNKTSGRLNKLQRMNYGSYQRLRRRLRKALPLVSDKEPNRLTKTVGFFEKNILDLNNEAAFLKSFNRVFYRIGILSRSHPALAENLRQRMRQIKKKIS